MAVCQAGGRRTRAGANGGDALLACAQGLARGDYHCVLVLRDTKCGHCARVRVRLQVGQVWHIGPGDSLQWTCDKAAAGDIVVLTDGSYTVPDEVNIYSKGLAITSANGPAQCVVGFQGRRGFHVHWPDGKPVVFDGLTIVDSTQAISVRGQGQVTVANCVIKNCETGLWCDGPEVTVSDCRVEGRLKGSETFGYGIYAYSPGVPVIRRCTIVGVRGTGLHIVGRGAILEACSIMQNARGALKFLSRGAPAYQPLVIRQCTIAENNGGIVYPYMGMRIENSIVWKNTGGIACDNSPQTDTATIVGSCIEGGWESGASWCNFSADPQLTYDVHLRATSPCIDAAKSAGLVRADVDGEMRLCTRRPSGRMSLSMEMRTGCRTGGRRDTSARPRRRSRRMTVTWTDGTTKQSICIRAIRSVRCTM
jgi:hypothetical protein